MSSDQHSRMACDSARAELVDLCDGRGSEAARAHVATCASCSALVRDASRLETALATLPAVPLPEGFERELAARLRAVAPTREDRAAPRWWLRPAAVGLAAMLVVVAGAALWLSRPSSPSIDVHVTQLVSVDVEVVAAAAVSGVDVVVALPDGLEVASEDEELAKLHTLAWKADLAAGVNRFNLVLRAASLGEHSVRVGLTAGAVHESMDLLVRTHAAEQASLPAWLGALAAGPRVRFTVGGPS